MIEMKDFQHRFIDACQQYSDNEAIVDGKVSLTYSQLNSITSIYAKMLLDRGTQFNQRIGVACGRGIEFIVAALSIMKSGAGFVPIDPEYPADRIKYIINDSEISFIFCCDAFDVDALPENIEVCKIDFGKMLALNLPSESVAIEIPSNALAYTIYTSGSTGKPKGVEIEHQNLANLIDWQLEYYDITSEDKASQLAKCSFDTSISEIWPFLTIGATVYIAPEEILLSPSELINWICETGITVCDVTTPLAEFVISERWPQYTSLRILKTGGDRLKKRPRKGLPFKFYNEYGPTECTVISTVGIVDHEGDGFPHIGVAIKGNVTHILDDKLDKVDSGSEGELYISGKSVGRGYVKLLDLTSEKFIDDPYIPGNKMYRTGDIVRLRTDGNIDYVGRRDFQIQIRGFRVELSEIEKVVLEHSKVPEVAVIAIEQEAGYELVCFVSLIADSQFDEAALRSYLIGKMPEYMVPSRIVVIEKMPLNSNGKIDRKLLLEMAKSTDSLDSSEKTIQKPRNPMEEVLWEIWKKLLTRDDFGIYDNFFDLGGHSLMLIRMESLLSKRGLYVPLQKILQNPQIAKLAAYLDFKIAGGMDNEDTCLVELNEGDPDKPAIFFVHSMSGDILGYSNLVHDLGEDQPCYGFQSSCLSDVTNVDRTIYEMANHYVEIMLEFQPEGPYILSGWCFGGFVAYEMARILKERGKDVGLLVLIDSPAMRPSITYLPYYIELISKLVSLGPIEMTKFIISYLRKKKQFSMADAIIGEAFSEQDDDIKNKYVSNRSFVYSVNNTAANNYRTKRYAGDILLFTAGEREQWILRGDTLGWRTLVRQVEVEVVQGGHGDIMKRTGKLSQILKERIDRLGNEK